MVRSVAKCRILAELGHGGMANVFLAVQRGQGNFNKLVVLKALRPELAVEPTLSMFLDEARVAAQLNHPNVVQTYEVGSHSERHVMVMEYLEGQAFSQVLRQADAKGETLSLAMRIRIVINALEGLHYAHELQSYDGTQLHLVHRDVSPQNIFVTYNGQVKVLDFGIAKAATSTTETAAGVVKGKLSYMAPEQLSGDAADRRADVFSMGCVLWSFATGERLFQDFSDVQIMRKLWDGDIPSPTVKNPNCDPEFARIIEKAMAIEPDDRYASAMELQADLERYAETLGETVRPKDIGRKVSDLFATKRAELKQLIELQLKRIDSGEDSSAGVPIVGFPDANPSGSRPIAAAARSRRWLPVAVVLALAVVAAAFIGSRQSPPPVQQPVVIQQAPAPEPASDNQESKAAQLELATLRFKVTPSDAQLYFDNRPLPQGTRSKVVPVDHAIHTLKAVLEGHRSASLEVAATGDQTIELELEKLGKDKAPSRPIIPRQRATRKPPAETKAPEALSEPDCSNPFFIDGSGIKRVRAECR